ncbi:hypothetical protein DPMN_186025 [Dreissena polymorpha]|uniref:Uncharacterized protein n=1 Tax=Dreissena polymorpha TaxID=45954 RepID=A0A9D4I659_DREPO|nr:hypothetical protein DPMN_186025 [Dreissena polymorpha]
MINNQEHDTISTAPELSTCSTNPTHQGPSVQTTSQTDTSPPVCRWPTVDQLM